MKDLLVKVLEAKSKNDKVKLTIKGVSV